MNCSVAIVLPGSPTAEIVVLSGDLLHAPPKGSSSFTPDKFSMVTAGPDRTAYLTTSDFSTKTITVWRVDANAAIPIATPITFTGDNFNGPVGATIGADGTAYIATQVVTQVVNEDGTQFFSYDTKLRVIAPDSDAPTSFQLDGLVYGPVAIDDGIAYVTTSRISFDDPVEPTVIWRVDPTVANPLTRIEVVGQPFSSVFVTPDGTAYQTVYRDDPDTDDNTKQYLMAVVSPGSTSPTLVDLGTFRSYFRSTDDRDAAGHCLPSSRGFRSGHAHRRYDCVRIQWHHARCHSAGGCCPRSLLSSAQAVRRTSSP